MTTSELVKSNVSSVDEWWIHTAQCWAGIVATVGVGGNILTIFTIIHQLYLGHVWNRRHRTIYHRGLGRLLEHNERPVLPLKADTLILLHLSLCDFIYCAVNLPLTAYTYSFAFTDVRPSNGFCQGAAYFRYSSALAEWLTLGFLAVERCVDLGRSKSSRIFKPMPTICCIVCIWATSLIMQFLVVKSDFAFIESRYKCDITGNKQILVFYAVETWLPCGLMLTGCFSIILQLWKHMKKLKKAGMPEDITRKRCRDMVKSTILVLALLLLFLLCVIPICVYNIAVSLGMDDNVPLNVTIFMVYWIQYGINYLVYVAINANYKKAYVQLIKAVFHTLCFARKREKEVNINIFLTATHPHLISTFSHLPPTLSHLHTVTAVPLHAYNIPQCRVLHSHSLYPDTQGLTGKLKGRRARTLSSPSVHYWTSFLHCNRTLASRCAVVKMETNIGVH